MTQEQSAIREQECQRLAEKMSVNWIKISRDAIGANNVELANYIGVSKAAIEKYISGENTPGLEVTLKLCKFFGLSLDEMFDLKKGEWNVFD